MPLTLKLPNFEITYYTNPTFKKNIYPQPFTHNIHRYDKMTNKIMIEIKPLFINHSTPSIENTF